MELELNSVAEVFIFIILCTIYVCSILWIYGDMATRGLAGFKGAFIAGLLAIPGFLAIPILVESPGLIAVILWPIGILVWISERPEEQEINSD